MRGQPTFSFLTGCVFLLVLYSSLIYSARSHENFIDNQEIEAVSPLPQPRPPGLPTYTPSSSEFDVQDFMNWLTTNYNQKKKTVAVAQGVFSVSPTDLSQGAVFNFNNLVNVTLWLDGVTFNFTEQKLGGFYWYNCTNFALHGVTTRYQTPTHSQVKITNIQLDPNDATTYFIDVQVLQGYPNTFFLNTLSPSAFLYTDQRVMVDNLWTLKQNSDLLSSDGNSIRLYVDKGWVDSYNPAPGYFLTARGIFTFFYSFDTSNRNSLIDVTILSTGGYGFFSFGGDGGHKYTRTKITFDSAPVEGGEAPLVSSSADGFHYISGRNGPIIQNCVFEGMQDDGVALHTRYGTVLSLPAQNQFQLDRNDLLFSPGDTVRIYNPILVSQGYASVVSYDPNANIITLSGDQALLSAIPVGWSFSNQNRMNSNFLVANSVFRRQRARALMLKSSNGKVLNNLIIGGASDGIVVGPELSWQEGDYSTNLLISGNRIANPYYFGSISISTEVDGYNPEAGGFLNINITNNTIWNALTTNLRFTSISNLRITNNTIIGPFAYPGQQPPVEIYNSSNVYTKSNCLINFNFTNIADLFELEGISQSGDITAGFSNCPNKVVPPNPAY